MEVRELKHMLDNLKQDNQKLGEELNQVTFENLENAQKLKTFDEDKQREMQ